MKIRVSVTVALEESEYFVATAYDGKSQFQVRSLSTTDYDKERRDIYASGVRLTKKGTPYRGGQQMRAWGFVPTKGLPEAIQRGLVDGGVLAPVAG